VGQHVDVSVRDIATAFLGPALLDSAMNRRENCRQGNRDEAMAPQGVYRCHGENAWVSIAVGSVKIYRTAGCASRRAFRSRRWAAGSVKKVLTCMNPF
jgi:crotonobetainyl-CoA:carnitine CoA-transferase CaiB-like acyl-CoA transferase